MIQIGCQQKEEKVINTNFKTNFIFYCTNDDINILASILTTLKAVANNKYVSAPYNGLGYLIANSDTIGKEQQFHLIRNSDGTVSFQAIVNGKYVCAEQEGNQPLIANRGAIASWEKFYLIDNLDGTVSFQALINEKYVCAEQQGNQPLIADRLAIGQWERFYLYSSSGKIS